jgi:uncharacterized membrane protein
MVILLALLIGIVAGLRAMMAPAAISWAAQRGWVDLSGTWLAFLGYRWTPWIFSISAIAELVTDQLPSTPSRKVPPQFGARVVMGALSGSAIGMHSGAWIAGLIAGALGAVMGTFGGSAARASMAKSFKSDRSAALIEDAVAIIGALVIVSVAG